MARVEAVEHARWQGREQASTVWKQESFPEDDLLRHVAHYLNPPKGISPTARLWSPEGNAVQSPQGLGATAEWRLTLPRGEVP